MAQHYRALTRTYRPQSFDDIVSQEHVISTLQNAIKQKRISHAYLFSGPRGVGKTTMARVLARVVNNVNEEVDGEALSQTLNIVEMDAASNRKIEDVRQLKEVIRVPPQQGNYKIFIIDEVHMLTKEAFNALLKTLEEPPAHAIFIFATTEPHKVLPTILSRVQRFDFKRIGVNEIVERLQKICEKEQISIDDESLHLIAKKADGALRDALGLMDQAIAFCGMNIEHQQLLQALNIVGHDLLFEFTDAVEKRSPDLGLGLIDRLMKEGTDIQEFLVSLTEHIRNLYVAKQDERIKMIEATADTQNRYIEASKAFSEEDLMRILHLVSEAQIKIKDVQQPRVHFEILMLKLVHMSRTKELGELLQGLNQLKKNGSKLTTSRPATSSSVKNLEDSPGSLTDKVPSQQHKPEVQKSSSSDPEAVVSSKNHDRPFSDSGRADMEKALMNPAGSLPAENSEQKNFSADTGTDTKEDDFLMIRPSLGYAKGISSSNGAEVQAQQGSPAIPEPSGVLQRALKGVEDIEQHWKSFLNLVKDNAPQMLYFQLLRLRLKNLKGSEVVVAADNEFATNLIQENQQLLSSLFKQTAGFHIRLKCIVERTEKNETELLSPYERFKELQKKDPHLRTIVELFGAELEY